MAATIATKFQPRLLTDEPAREDKLELGAHNAIASAIAKLIVNSGTAGAIALVGRMGSGKSSIVEMLKRNHLSEFKNVRVFVFDAWAHQGDSLRRIFLQQLGDNLLEKESSNPLARKRYQNWQTEFESKTVVRQWSREHVTPTIWGSALAIAAFFTAVGLLLLSRESNAGMAMVKFVENLPFLSALNDADKLGTSFLVLAILVISATFVFFGAVRLINHFSVLGQPLNLAREVVSTTSVQSLDPSSVEFAALFGYLMEQLDIETRKVLIVVDNLDRVPREAVWNLWSTLQVFIELRTTEQARNWKDKLWILAAFDQDVLIQNAGWDLKDVEQKPNKARAQRTSAVPTEELVKPEERIRALMDKTFQITFHVPLPPLSAWEKYFASRFQEVFGRDYDADARKVASIYRICRSKTKLELPPTPREINLFLNNLLGLWWQWQNKIPIEIVALYAFFAEDMAKAKNPHQAITEKALLNPNILNIVELNEPKKSKKREKCLQYLAALYFGVEPESAGHALVETSLRETLFTESDKSAEKLNDLIGAYPQGLLSLIQKIIEEDDQLYSTGAAQRVANLAANLEHIQAHYGGKDAHAPSNSWTNIWERVCAIAGEIPSWDDCEVDSWQNLIRILQPLGCRHVTDLVRKKPKSKPVADNQTDVKNQSES